MSVIIALTGASGNMGRECLRQLLELDEVEKVKILVRRTPKDRAVRGGGAPGVRQARGGGVGRPRGRGGVP